MNRVQRITCTILVLCCWLALPALGQTSGPSDGSATTSVSNDSGGDSGETATVTNATDESAGSSEPAQTVQAAPEANNVAQPAASAQPAVVEQPAPVSVMTPAPAAVVTPTPAPAPAPRAIDDPTTAAGATARPASQPASASTSRPTSAATSRPSSQPTSQPTTGPRGSQPTTGKTTSSASDEIALSFSNAPVDQIAKFISEKKEKPVIPSESIKSKTITIVSSKKMTLTEAMSLLAEAMRQNGMILEEYPNLINIKSLAEVKQTRLTVVPADQSVSKIPEKTKIVDKIFAIKHYDVTKLRDVILPMLPAAGHMTADPNARVVVITDTVGNLERIEQMINALDLATADQAETKIFPIKKGDAREIIPVVRFLIAGSMGSKFAKDILTSGATSGGSSMPGASSGGGPRPSMGGGGPEGMVMGPNGPMSAGGPRPSGPSGSSSGSPSGGSGAQVVFVEESKTPVMLMADVSRNWIIAVAPPHILDQIEQWVTKLDEPGKVEEAFDVLEVQHADINEVAQQIGQTIDAIPDADVRSTVRVVPYVQSRKLLVFGSQRGRIIVKQLLDKLDIEASEYQKEEVFKLKNADAEEVAAKIDSLYSNMTIEYKSSYSTSYSRDRSSNTKVKAVADTRRNTVTVITDPVTMEKIRKLVEDLDLPLDLSEIQPKIYTLVYADPVQVKKILEGMFSKKDNSSSSNLYSYFFGRGNEDDSSGAAVGRLYGQYSFQAMPNSSKLIVTCKSAANYDVLTKLILELDQPQDAGLPVVIELKHANAEDLSEQLNSLLSEPGTLAEILRSQRDLSVVDRSSVVPPRNGSSSYNPGQPNAGQDNQQPRAGVMSFWWQRSRERQDQMPSSNLIGKIRFMPVNRRNALMVLAPQGYIEPVQKLVADLDRPGLQVMIRAVIAEVQHDDVTTLGLRIAADPSVLSDPRLTDSAIRGSGSVDANQLWGGTFNIGNQTFGRTVLHGNLNVFTLIQMLMQKFNMKVLLEPRLYTADNQQAEFFDGRDVPILTETRVSAEGATTVSDVAYAPIGTRLRVRPHITQEGGVDLNINLEISRIVPGESVLNNLIFDRQETTTHVIVGNGQTVMLSGIVRQENFDEVRKVPLLGDLPLLGPLFRSCNTSKRNRELVAFITPIVIGNQIESDEKLKEPIEATRKLKAEMSPDGGVLLDGGPGEDGGIYKECPPTSQPGEVQPNQEDSQPAPQEDQPTAEPVGGEVVKADADQAPAHQEAVR